jgi:GT2 family glycosyltransferase
LTQSEPRVGLSRARNKGWRAATGDIIAFTDDDCYVDPNYVDAIFEAFQEDLRIGFVGGRILLFDATDYKITINESEVRQEFRPRIFVPTGAVQGANFAFRKTVLQRIGGFDERLGAGTPFPSEDIDMVASALWSGVIGVYDPRPLVYHHHGRKTWQEALMLMRTYDAGRGAYYAKYVMRSDSRCIYLREWLKSIKNECIDKIKRGGFPGKSARELYFALKFMFVRP